ncbi:M23 family metallopeptidase [Variovorax sp. GT1P44]|uniref:M23 family metallopeptidase n=1 Tax=Variovorax sp. GT1P44 TaxID=3443742 RepID=UPI003F46D911
MAKADRNFLKPAGGAVIARFDGRRNKGVDFAGGKGDPVYAARDGRVVYSAAGPRGYGQLVMIKHDASYVTAYAHNSQLLVKEGQSVKRGQVIARMGSTESDRVKLHFELRKNGNAVDPLQYLESGEAAAPAAASEAQ